ncbi:MAG TPA: MATE family efflux transporter [Thermomicrobiales bacterium]
MALELQELVTPIEERESPPIVATASMPVPSMYRRVINLAWPVIAQNLLETFVGVVDTILVARLGAAAIAGVGTALQVLFFLLSILSAVTVGASIMVAHAIGAGDPRNAIKVAKQALSWGLFAALPVAALGAWGAGRIIGTFGVADDVAAVGTSYLQITMITLPGLLLVFVAGAILRGAGDTRTPMLVGIVDNIINASLAWALIYGHLGLPTLGAEGSAWAAATSRFVGASVLLIVLIRGRGALKLRGWFDWRPRFAPVRRVLALGVPAAIEQSLIATAFTMMTIIIAALGTSDLAAQRISFNALSVGFLPGIGFGMATSVLVGQSLGAGRKEDARAAAHAAAVWVCIWMGVMATLFFIFANPIMHIFTADPAVAELGARSMRVLAFSLPLWGQGFVWAGALRGAGNTRLPLITNTTGMWLGVGLSFLLIEFFNPSLPIIWAVCLPGWALNAFLVWRGFRRDKLTHLSGAPAAMAH